MTDNNTSTTTVATTNYGDGDDGISNKRVQANQGASGGFGLTRWIDQEKERKLKGKRLSQNKSFTEHISLSLPIYLASETDTVSK